MAGEMYINWLNALDEELISRRGTDDPTPPLFEHDCDEGCVYLGRYNDSYHGVVDLWIHTYGDERLQDASLIYRYGDYGGDYGCFPDTVLESGSPRFLGHESNSSYIECYLRAERAGLI